MPDSLPLLAALVALLVGLIAGKAWERYKLHGGRWLDRRKLRQTPHYMLGLNFLGEGQVDRAIDELSRAASDGTDALELQMILGNLHRQKGQVGKAVSIHQALLQRQDLSRAEHAYLLLCLGLDYRGGGFVDRAREAFEDVLRLDPANRHALVNLAKLHEEQRQWTEALAARTTLGALRDADTVSDRQIEAFLHNEIGRAQAARGLDGPAARAFADAIERDACTAPAYLNLGDVRARAGDMPGAIDAWERLIAVVPERAHLAFDRLDDAYARAGAADRFRALCERLISEHPENWRARLALARHLRRRGLPGPSVDLLFDALAQHPHGLALHQAIWQILAEADTDPALVRRYVTASRDAVFYLDPHVCVRCRYRSTELLWLCPQCHEWNTFVEERIAQGRDSSEAELAPPANPPPSSS